MPLALVKPKVNESFAAIKPVTPDKVLTDLELCRCFEAAGNVGMQDKRYFQSFCFRLVMGTGMRCSEMSGRSDAGFQAAFTPQDIHRAEYDDTGRQVSTTWIQLPWAKGNKPRKIGITPELERPLLKHVARIQYYSLRWMFPSLSQGNNERPLSSPHVALLWKNFLIWVGVRPLPIHCGRHTFASWELHLGRIGGPRGNTSIALAQQLGHSNSTITEQYYLHALPGRLFCKEDPAWLDVAMRSSL